MKVYVITCPELGWDCVVGVFDVSKVSVEELLKRFPYNQYVVHEDTKVETSLKSWDD